MTVPQSPDALDDETALVRPIAKVVYAFCAALVAVLLLGLFVIVPDAVVTLRGLALGLGLGVVALVVPPILMRSMLTGAARRRVQPENEYAVVRSAFFVGLAFAETPALVGFALSGPGGGNHEVGPLVGAVPFAIVSLLVNVGGPAATRLHLRRLRGSTTPGLAPM